MSRTVLIEDDLVHAIERLGRCRACGQPRPFGAVLAMLVGTGVKIAEAQAAGDLVLVERTDGQVFQLVPR